ncbi:MAG TPA: hypothetical protein PLI90_10305, partial [Rhodocyclaceae bacterium]|nr:hypothetical protein [Rhodocyclaceae bacterium]
MSSSILDGQGNRQAVLAAVAIEDGAIHYGAATLHRFLEIRLVSVVLQQLHGLWPTAPDSTVGSHDNEIGKFRITRHHLCEP